MSEIEVKIFGVDKKKLIKKLKELKAVKEYEGLFKVAYFDFQDRRIQKAGEVFRLRQSQGKKAELVYKFNRRNMKGLKVCNELNTNCNDMAEMEKILLKIGLNKTLYYERRRTTYKFQIPNFKFQILVEFDEYPNGFSYLEIEANSSKNVLRGISLLGLEKHEKSTETVDEVFDRKFGKGSLNGMRF